MFKNQKRLLVFLALATALSQGFENCRASGAGAAVLDEESDDEFHYAGALPLAASLMQQPGGASSSTKIKKSVRFFEPEAAASRVQALKKVKLKPSKSFQVFQAKIARLRRDISALLEEASNAAMSRANRYALLKKEKELYENLIFNNFPISEPEIDSYRLSLHLAQQGLQLMDAEDVLVRHGASMSRESRVRHENDRDLALVEILKAEKTSAALREAARLNDLVQMRQQQLEEELKKAAELTRKARQAVIDAEEESSGRAALRRANRRVEDEWWSSLEMLRVQYDGTEGILAEKRQELDKTREPLLKKQLRQEILNYEKLLDRISDSMVTTQRILNSMSPLPQALKDLRHARLRGR